MITSYGESSFIWRSISSDESISTLAFAFVFSPTQMLQLAANEVVKVTCSTPAGLALSMQSTGPFNGISVHLIK